MKNIHRRDVLRAGVAASVAGALSSGAVQAFVPRTAASDKLLLIFLRGAYDAVNTVIPIGDSAYTSTNRGPTYINPATTLPIPGTSFFGLHPALQPMQNVVQSQRIAFLHAVGNPARTGSHFEDQRTWETAITQCGGTSLDPEEGWVARAAGTLLSGFSTASVSTNHQQFFRSSTGAFVQPHVRRILDFPGDTIPRYSLVSNKPALDAKFRGASPQTTPPGFGLRKMFESGSINTLDGFTRANGIAMLDSEQAIAALGTTYTPANGAIYPFGKTGASSGPFQLPSAYMMMSNSGNILQFFHNLRDAMWILRNTSACIVGVEVGSFDTHSDQGGATGQLAALQEALAVCANTIDIETQADPNIRNLTTLYVSEFARTSAVNQSGGTDHGGATCVWAQGERVRLALAAHPSSVIIGENSVPAPWPGMFSANDSTFGCNPNPSGPGTFVDMRSDFRAVFGEAIRKILAPSASQMDFIIPGYTAAFQNAGREMNFMV